MAEDATATSKGRDAWLRAGQELMRGGGIAAVKLRALTQALGLTTGSFYHHFSGMRDYLDQLARYYGAEQVHESLAVVDHADPKVRLRRLDALMRNERKRPLDFAMRDWAGSNELAATAVQEADEILLRFIERAFRDLGFGRKDAQLRALLIFSPGVARIRVPWRVSSRVVDDVIDILAP